MGGTSYPTGLGGSERLVRLCESDRDTLQLVSRDLDFVTVGVAKID